MNDILQFITLETSKPGMFDMPGFFTGSQWICPNKRTYHMDIANLPFNKVLGLKADGNSILLVPQSQHLNHVNTIHAAVIFSVAEAAAGQCLLQRFPDLTQTFVAVLRSTNTKYRRPASTDSSLRGTGTLGDVEAVEFLEALQSRGRAMVDVFVSVVQNELEIFSGTFTWFAAPK